jgi:hypothetical protein
MSSALMWATARYPVEPPFAVNLPADTPRVTYNNVVRDGTRRRGLPMTPKVENLPSYHVAEVRIRGTRAQVDVVLPEQAEAAATTVTFRHTMGAWRMQDSRSWIAGVIPVPAPHYIPGSVEEPAPPQTLAEPNEQVDPESTEPAEPDTQPMPMEAEPPAEDPEEQLEDWAEEQQAAPPAEPEAEEPPAEQLDPDEVLLVEQGEEAAEELPADAIRYVLHPDGTISRGGEVVDLPRAFAGIDKDSAVHLTIEQAADGTEASTAEAVIASFRIRGVEQLVVERVAAEPPAAEK